VRRPGNSQLAQVRRNHSTQYISYPDFPAVQEILKPYDPGLMRHYPVSPRVNSVQNDDADCAAPITLELPEQARLF
jgi:putative SOS response-associated peptidase YedK